MDKRITDLARANVIVSQIIVGLGANAIK